MFKRYLTSLALLGALVAHAQINPNQVEMGHDYWGTSEPEAITACGTADCVWHITGQVTISSSLTVPGNIKLAFEGGGNFAVASGANLTLTSPVTSASPVAHIFQLAGTASVSFDKNQKEVAAGWLGAVGDGSTNDSTPIQNALNACFLAQCDVTLLDKTYSIGTTSLLEPSNVGLIGPPVWNVYAGASHATILSNSPSAAIINLGAAGNTTQSVANSGQRIKRVQFGRSVLPVAGSRGVSCNASTGSMLEDVLSFDSYSDFYYNGCPSGGSSGDIRLAGGWGLNGLSGYPSTAALVFIEVDSENGLPMNTHWWRQFAVGSFTGQPTTPPLAQYIHGTQINDLNFFDANTSLIGGISIVYDGSGNVGSAYDVHNDRATYDGCAGPCVAVSGLPTGGSVTMAHLYAIGDSAAPAVQIQNGYGIDIAGAELGNLGAGSAMLLSGTADGHYQDLKVRFINAGVNVIRITKSLGNTFDNFSSITGQPGKPNAIFDVEVNNFDNTFSNIRMDGGAAIGMYFDATSGLNILSGININPSTPGLFNQILPDFSSTGQASPNCPLLGIPTLTLGSPAGSGATIANVPGVPQHNCDFTVSITPGSGATSGGPLLTASFNQTIGIGGASQAANMPGQFSCAVTPVLVAGDGTLYAALSQPALITAPGLVQVYVANALTGKATYHVKCGL